MQGNRDAELAAIQNRELFSRLTEANIRIGELQSERDNLERMLKATLLLAEAATDERQLFPAVRIDAAMRMLTLVQRRDLWLAGLTKLGLDGAIFGLFPHNGETDPITILVSGSGGFGDMITHSCLVRRLYERFSPARIVVLEAHPEAHRIFASNPYVLSTISLKGEQKQQFFDLAACLDIFDLLVDVRYAVTYAAPPLSRIPHEFLLAAHSRSSEWQRFVRRDWPFLNNMLGQEAMRRGMTEYDLMGYTANLPIATRDAGDFFPVEPADAALVAPLVGNPYITVHHGSDRVMSAANGVQTKNLPKATWQAVVALLKLQGWTTVQLGEEHEPPIEGVAVDLRGKSSFDHTAQIIKHAHAHIDTEGGLVHLARAMGTRSVVMFGPTPAAFFGYPANVNVQSQGCANCWWVGPEWARSCVRGFAGPECMAEHAPEKIVDLVLRFARSSKTAVLQGAMDVGEDAPSPAAPLETAVTRARSQFRNSSRTAVAVRGLDLLKLCFAHFPAGQTPFDGFVPLELFGRAAEVGQIGEVRPYSPVHIPAETDSYDGLFLDLRMVGPENAATLLAEAIRVTRPDGEVLIFDESPHEAARARLTALGGKRIPGARSLVKANPKLLDGSLHQARAVTALFRVVETPTDVSAAARGLRRSMRRSRSNGQVASGRIWDRVVSEPTRGSL
ncbi:MAG: glycosyltransferase family 9 protein [Alphaproteobacteria bacterium]|nr:glycosyltransferase family 9 protein [Alphaproteobacteria bacterium]